MNQLQERREAQDVTRGCLWALLFSLALYVAAAVVVLYAMTV